MQDNRPNQSQCKFRVSVHDVLSPDVHELDLLVSEEVQRHLDILQHVETHPTSLTRLEEEKILVRT